MASGGNVVPHITKAEHIGPNDTGDNISAKRVANYVWDGSAWVRSQGSALSYATRIDDFTTTSVTYVGKAPIGSAVGSAVWQIQKIDETTGMVITWADGNDSFDNVWGAAGAVAGLSYS